MVLKTRPFHHSSTRDHFANQVFVEIFLILTAGLILTSCQLDTKWQALGFLPHNAELETPPHASSFQLFPEGLSEELRLGSLKGE